MAYLGRSPLPIVAGGTAHTINPSFQVYLSTSPNDITGDGTYYQVPFDTVEFDTTSSYNATDFWYVIPVTGKYLFSSFLLSNGDAMGNNNGVMSIYNNTVGQNFPTATFNVHACSVGTQLGWNGSIIIPCTSGDEIFVYFVVNNGAKGVGLVGGPQTQTYFCGYLLT